MHLKFYNFIFSSRSELSEKRISKLFYISLVDVAKLNSESFTFCCFPNLKMLQTFAKCCRIEICYTQRMPERVLCNQSTEKVKRPQSQQLMMISNNNDVLRVDFPPQHRFWARNHSHLYLMMTKLMCAFLNNCLRKYEQEFYNFSASAPTFLCIFGVHRITNPCHIIYVNASVFIPLSPS